jgi:hypothetical protein
MFDEMVRLPYSSFHIMSKLCSSETVEIVPLLGICVSFSLFEVA